MNAVENEKIYISQICYAHSVLDNEGNEKFINIYPHKVVLEMFEGANPVVVNITEAKEDEETEYWAWYNNRSLDPYMFIWSDKEKTLRCLPNYEQKEKNNEGRVVRVVVERIRSL